MRVILHLVSIACILAPNTLTAQVLASETTLLAMESWSGTFSATFADTSTSRSGDTQVLIRSVHATVRFTGRRPQGTTRVNWSGTGGGEWRVDDRITSQSPRGPAVVQGYQGEGKTALDDRYTSLRIDAARNTYQFSFRLEPFRVDLITEGGSLNEPMRSRARPRRGGGLGGSVRNLELPANGHLLSGDATLEDGTVLRWSFSPDTAVATDEQAAITPALEEGDPPTAESVAPTDLNRPPISMNRLGRDESGVAWFEDRWDQPYRIASVEVIPPMNDFDGLDHTIVIKVMDEDGVWNTIAEAAVKPGVVAESAGWTKHHPIPINPSYFEIRLEKSLTEPITARGIRFELLGAQVMGGAWTFWVRSASQPATVGETRYEWKYTHVW